MPVLSVRVPDDLAARFDAAARPMGGRSALLFQLIHGATPPGPEAAPVPTPQRDACRLMVRLAAAEASHIAREAAALGQPRATWVAALVRRHTTGHARFCRADELVLIAIQGELRRIGVNINQIARALNTAVMEGRVLDLELTYLEELRGEMRGHLGAIRDAFAGNLAYWDSCA